MSAPKHRHRPLHQGVRCAMCRQLASDCRCDVFSLAGAFHPLEPEDLGVAAQPFVEGSVFPVDASTTTFDVAACPAEERPIAPTSSSPTLSGRRARRSVRTQSFALLLGLLLLPILLAGVLFFTLPAPVTVDIHPATGIRNELITVKAVTTRTAPLESQARLLTDTRTSPTLSITATEVVQQPAVQATGKLTFYNIAPSVQQIRAGIIFTIAGGMQVVSDSAVTLPAGNPPDSLGSATVSAHVRQTGTQGNIPANTINGLCPCGNAGVSVKNAPFSGGRDAATYTVLTQADVDGVVIPERTTLIQQATAGVKAQMLQTERLASAVSCTSSEALDHQVGSRTTQGHVTVSASCQGEVYDQQDIEATAAMIFRQDMRRALTQPAVLTSSPIATITHTAFADQRRGTLSFLVHVEGWWIYPLDAARLSRQIAGKTYNQALSLLLHTPGIEHATVQQRGNGWLRLPDDPRQITITIITPQTAA